MPIKFFPDEGETLARKTVSRKDPNYASYLLRVWRDHEEAPWRFSLQSTAAGQPLYFADMESLFVFLNEQINTGKVHVTEGKSKNSI